MLDFFFNTTFLTIVSAFFCAQWRLNKNPVMSSVRAVFECKSKLCVSLPDRLTACVGTHPSISQGNQEEKIYIYSHPVKNKSSGFL